MIDNVAYEKCAMAITIDAMNEYLDALMVLRKTNVSEQKRADAQYAAKSWEKFIRSEFFGNLYNMDGDVLERIVQRRAREGGRHFKMHIAETPGYTAR